MTPVTPSKSNPPPNKSWKQVQRVSKRAALASKRKIWDSNDASIDVAQTAVDHWENAYTALRGLLVASSHSAGQLYGAAKAGANGLEHGLLVPVRDWILLPAFWGVERATVETVGFLQSDQAKVVADASLDVVRRVPFVGDKIVAPVLVKSADLAKAAWHVAQYPIPSKAAVRDSVDFVMTGTKWALTTAGREIYFYAKIVDANITRTLMHTQWKVLGSGPYGTLDKIHKEEVIDHICERYFSLVDVIQRYELAAHIRSHNPILYHDLVLTGLLRDRGKELTRNDAWLSRSPSYRLSETPFLLPPPDSNDFTYNSDAKVKPLWFRLRYQNGKRPGRDVPWVQLSERDKLEERYLSFLANARNEETTDEGLSNQPRTDLENIPERAAKSSPYPTVAQWYEPKRDRDILIDQKRHALSYLLCCSKCRGEYESWRPPLVLSTLGSFCNNCKETNMDDRVLVSDALLPPPVKMIMRPTLWRFHGPGDEVRRAVWFLDTQRHGLQPYNEESAAVLEDAYFFLKWKLSDKGQKKVNETHGDLLTVEVPSPNGAETQLVQFRSLAQVTAIPKTLGSAVSLFKRRVYRGVANEIVLPAEPRSQDSTVSAVEKDERVPPFELEESIEVESKEESDSVTIEAAKDIDVETSLTVPSSRVTRGNEEDFSIDRDEVDHLVLIVHGIGEMLRSIDLLGGFLPALSSIVDCCQFLRTNHDQIYAAQSEEARRLKERMRGRVEFLPVEWHEAFALQSQREPASDAPISSHFTKGERPPNANMNDISLRTIPQMRAFANDTLLDILYFMSPEHHDKMIDIVTSEMNLVVNKFRSLTGFKGKISLIGHSLGSVISWDILANQIPATGISESYEPPSLTVLSPSSASTISCGSFLQPSPQNSPTDGNSSSQLSESDTAVPEMSAAVEVNRQQMSAYPQLEFEVQNAFMLGSPIPVFLMIRNQHKPLSENFYLSGCRRVFNIFHPYDPVAYRIEPLLDPMNAEIDPRIIMHWKGGFRVQYQTKLLWRKMVDETWKTQQNVINAVERQIAGLGLLDGTTDVLFDDDEEVSDVSSEDHRLGYVNCGSLNQGHRIDYMLQEKEIENATEYVAALAAHSSYWKEKDFSLFVARQIYRAQNDEMSVSTSGSRPSTPQVDNDTVNL